MTWSLEALCFHTSLSIRPRRLPLTARQKIRLTTLPSAESGEGACATSGWSVARTQHRITTWLLQNSRPSSSLTTTRLDDHHTNSMYSAWKRNRNQRNSKLNWGTSSACFPYSQKRQLKNSGTVCERPGRRHAQQPWAGRRGSTKSGLHLTPGHLSPRGRTLKTESTRRKIKMKNTNYRPSTGRRTDRWRKVQGRTKEATLRSWPARQRLQQANETWRDCTR